MVSSNFLTTIGRAYLKDSFVKNNVFEINFEEKEISPTEINLEPSIHQMIFDCRVLLNTLKLILNGFQIQLFRRESKVYQFV